MNTIKIKHGTGDPSGKLQPYELGFRDDTDALYINNDGTIQQLTGLAASGLVDSSNYLVIPTIPAATAKQTKILVANDNNVVYSRTPAQICGDIGAFASSGGTVSGDTTFSKTVTITDQLTANGKIIVKEGVSYGYQNPNDAEITGTVGQLYFVITG